MSRDLLYKPPTPSATSVDETGSKAQKKRGRSLDVQEQSAETPKKAKASSPQPTDKPTPAYQASYFNKDVAATVELNFRTSDMEALRGTPVAVDLKNVVLPPLKQHSDKHDPALLAEVIDKMGLNTMPSNLQTVLARHAAWANSRQTKPADLAERMVTLKRMIEDRRVDLSRMKKQCSTILQPLQHAVNMQSDPHVESESQDALQKCEDLLQQGRTAAQPMFKHLQKIHRISKKP